MVSGIGGPSQIPKNVGVTIGVCVGGEEARWRGGRLRGVRGRDIMALCIMSKCRGGGILRVGTFRHSQECRNEDEESG